MNICKYDKFEMAFTTNFKGNPFEIKFYAMVQLPNGKKIKVPGFYDGENIFKLRIMPEMEGSYAYKTYSSLPALKNKKGTFHCISSRPNEHGKVIVHNKFWFSHMDGKSFFQVGTTCYAWLYQNEELQKKTMETLKTGPFNKVRMCVFPKWYEFNHKQPEIFPFEGTIGSFDYSRPNIAWFRKLDDAINELRDNGIQADIILFHPYDNPQWGFSAMNRKQDITYLKYIIARLSAYSNVWWSLANEYDLFQRGYKKNSSSWKKLIKYVAMTDPSNHLVSIHNGIKIFNHRYHYITHCSIQRNEIYHTAENIDYWREKYQKPVIVDECGYEGDLSMSWGGITGEEMLRRFWEATARGGYVGHGETYQSFGEYLWWAHGGELHGTSPQRLQFLRKIMDEVPDICLSSMSGKCEYAAAEAENNTLLNYYGFHQPANVTLRLPKSSEYRVRIIDTWNMTIETLDGLFNGEVRICLPRKPYCAILCTAVKNFDASVIKFDADTQLREAIYKRGGKKFLRILNFGLFISGMKKIKGMVMKLTINDMIAHFGSDEERRAQLARGLCTIINENKLIKGLFIAFRKHK